MKRTNQITIAIDVDDVLADCNAYAMKTAKVDANLEDLTSWTCELVDKYSYLFHDASFVASQPVLPGAQKFVNELRRRNIDLLFVTAVKTDVATARIQWLADNFSADYTEVVITSRKDKIEADILIDDAPHNVLTSIATWPILFRRPWNSEVTGMLAVNNFDDLLLMVDSIVGNNHPTTENQDIICLVGPSGAGKTEIVEELCKDGFTVPCIKTTAISRSSYYEQVPSELFNELKTAGGFVETTSYAGDSFGVTFKEMEIAISTGKKVVIPIDLCGANALKRFYGERVCTVYIKKPREELIANILQKNISDKCKALRILALDTEEKNAALCDYVVENNDAKEAAKEIKGEN